MQYYTLEEAAKALQMTPDTLREMAKKKQIRAFQDRGTWRFRAQDVVEEARKRGLADSDPALQLSDATIAPPAPRKGGKDEDERLAVDFSLDDEVPIGREKPSEGPRSSKSSGKSGGKSSGKNKPAAPGSDSDVRLVLDGDMDFNIDLDSDVRLGGGGKSGPKKKPADDSGVRLVPPDDPSDSDAKVAPGKKTGSDSDIRLDAAGKARDKGKEGGIVTEEIDLDAEERKAKESTVKPRKPKLTQHQPGLPTSSPFELSESDARAKPAAKNKKKADTDSSDDFEAIPFDKSKSTDSSSGEIPLLDDEVGLGNEISAGKGNSGINLDDPVDSGISLEGSDDEIEFELSLDSGTTPKPAKSAPRKKDQAPAPAADDSSSEFELSLDDAPSDPSDSEFELSLDEDSGDGLAMADSGSDSEFELTLDDEGGLAAADEENAKDIFEETNFDVPALDEESGSEAVALDEGDTDLEGSDFEISLEDSSTAGGETDSQVVALEDQEEADDMGATVARPKKGAKPAKGGKAPAKAKKKALVESEEDIVLEEQGAADDSGLDLSLDDSSGAAPKKKPAKKKKAVAELDEEEPDEEILTDEEEEAAVAAVAAPAEWGLWPILLFPTVLVMFVVSIMGFELVRGMWGYQRSTRVATPIVEALSKLGQ